MNSEITRLICVHQVSISTCVSLAIYVRCMGAALLGTAAISNQFYFTNIR